jgi:murein DD-endopeptidase MepM/ murein hydrolase activator NlpD
MTVAVLAFAILVVPGRTPGAAASQQSPAPQTTALLVTSTNAPLRVLGSDGLEHLEYDLVFTNFFTAPVTLTAINVIGPDGSNLLELHGEALAENTAPMLGGAPSAVIPLAGTLATVIDVALPADTVPAQITHRISYDLPADAPALTVIGRHTVNGPVLNVDPRIPLVISSPLRGDGWLSANGCCEAYSAHRYFRLAVDGIHLVKPETFAIDWMQLQGGRLFSGDGSRNEQYFCFGADILSVAAGTVVSIRDGMPEESPNQPVTAVMQPADYAGNAVVVQIAPGTWATYAHLQPGSIHVAVGDHITAGQLLGTLGNSGNSTAPHLHFQLSDGADILTSNSLPFVFDQYVLGGTVDPGMIAATIAPPVGEDGVATEGAWSEIALQGPAQPQSGTYPLILTVADFP